MFRSRATLTLLTLVGLSFFVAPIMVVPMAKAADKGAVRQSVNRAANYLRSVQQKSDRGRLSLCTYALLKADGKPSDAGNKKGIQAILNRCKGEYTPVGGTESIYTAGIEAMLLSSLDMEKYRSQLQLIADYLVKEQLSNGSFDYRSRDAQGDTSVSQYGALGLWAAARAGADVPGEAWDKLAAWHFKTQEANGGFMYIPGKTNEGVVKGINTSMSAAAASSITICAMFLYPERFGAAPVREKKTAEGDPNDPLGILTIKSAPAEKKVRQPSGPYRPRASLAELKGHASKAGGFVANNFDPEYREAVRMYNFYTLERMGALLEMDKFGGRDWFDICADKLLADQQDEGSWDWSAFDAASNRVVGTSFAVLFLTRSTAKLLNRAPKEDPLGGGVLAGGRGLPDDLSSVQMEDGRVKTETSTGPLDDLLKALESAGSDDLFNVQTQIVKKIQLGDRNELIGQIDRVVALVDHPSPDIRRIALWAMARSNDLTLSHYAIEALLDDPDRDVLIEAHNALCWMSRRPNAFGIPDDPLGNLPPDAPDDKKREAVEKWRALALKKWGQWYLRTCPYEQKSSPFAVDLARRIGAK